MCVVLQKKKIVSSIRIDCNTERKNACGSKNVKSTIPPNDDEKSKKHGFVLLIVNSD